MPILNIVAHGRRSAHPTAPLKAPVRSNPSNHFCGLALFASNICNAAEPLRPESADCAGRTTAREKCHSRRRKGLPVPAGHERLAAETAGFLPGPAAGAGGT